MAVLTMHTWEEDDGRRQSGRSNAGRAPAYYHDQEQYIQDQAAAAAKHANFGPREAESLHDTGVAGVGDNPGQITFNVNVVPAEQEEIEDIGEDDDKEYVVPGLLNRGVADELSRSSDNEDYEPKDESDELDSDDLVMKDFEEEIEDKDDGRRQSDRSNTGRAPEYYHDQEQYMHMNVESVDGEQEVEPIVLNKGESVVME